MTVSDVAPGVDRSQALQASSVYHPLAGVRVVELCWVWAGPLLGQLLADLGAEVVKCEWYKRHDPYRTRGVERLRGRMRESRRRESSHSFHSLNRNKIGFAADLKDPDGLALVKELIAESDLLIENFTAGTLERLGLGPETLKELNDRLTVVSLSGFGAGSALEHMRAYGLILSALGGVEAGVRDDGEFIGSPTFVFSDPNAALFGLFASVGGLLHAQVTGSGSTFLGSQLEAVIALAGAERRADPSGACVDVTVQAADGVYVAVSAGAATVAEIEALAGSHDAAALVAELERRSVAAAPVLDVVDTEDADAFSDLEVRVDSVHPVTGAERLVAAPWRIDGRRAPLRKPAPLLGEGDEYVLRTVLGLDEDEADARRQSERVVELAPSPASDPDQPGTD